MLYRIKQDSIFSLVQLEDSSQWRFKAHNLQLRNGGLEDVPLLPAGKRVRSSPPPAPKKISGIGVLLSQM